MTSCAIDGALVLSDSGFAAGTVLVEDRHIAGVAWSAAECEALRGRARTVVAAQGHWLIPGLVDGHAHGYAALLRGTQNSLPLELAPRGIVSSPSLTLLFTRECEHNEGTKNDPSEYGYIERYCNLVDDVRQVAKLRWPAKEQFISIKILTRSTGDVVDNLGRVAAWYYERDPPVQLKVPEYSAVDEKGTALMHTVPCGEKWDTGRKSGQSENWYKCIPLLNIKKGCTPGESVKAFVSVLYQGETYCVPKDEREAGHTPAVFEIVHQLIAYDKVAKDLPAANILSVTPIP